MSQTYPTAAAPAEAQIEVKKSRFIARAAPVNDREAALAVVEQARVDHPDARHWCWAYLLGDPVGSASAAMNDDGEPSGTAGKPILNVIQHKGIGDIVVVVIRYFGGIKLGAGGLTRAYAGATEAVLSTVERVEQEPLSETVLRADFAQEQVLRHWAGQHGAQVLDVAYGEGIALRLQLPTTELEELERFCAAQHIAIRQGDA